MDIRKHMGGWALVSGKHFLSAALLSVVISACPARADEAVAPPVAGAAEDIGHAVDEHEHASGRSAWRSRTRYIPIETLISDNLQQLRENAEMVFVGELTESWLENDEEGSVPITRYDFTVETFLKGESFDIGTISLSNFGGRSERTGETVSTQFSFDFVVGERYLVFLRPDFAKSALPIISAMSVHEGGDVLANANGEQLVRLDDQGGMGFSTAASYAPLNYGFTPQDSVSSAPVMAEMPVPMPGSGDVDVIAQDTLSSTVKDLQSGLSEGVQLDSVVDQIVD